MGSDKAKFHLIAKTPYSAQKTGQYEFYGFVMRMMQPSELALDDVERRWDANEK